jgi:protein SCO1/2
VSPASPALAGDPFKVIASIKPVHSILSSLMEGLEEPELLVGRGRIPYGYELTDTQKADLSEADLIIWLGPELETFLVDPLKHVKPGATVEALLDNSSLKILQSRWNGDRRDPYFWLDSRNAIIMMDELTELLIRKDPTRAHLYKRNREKLFARLAELDRRLEYGYRGLKSGIGIAYYDTLQYFEQAYALKIRDVVAESPVQPVQARQLLDGHGRLSEGYYTCLFTESLMPMNDMDLLLGDTKINTAELDSFGSKLQPGPDLYLDLMDYNTRVIKQCLDAKRTETDGDAADDIGPRPNGIRGKFMLVDQDGKVVTETDMQGKYQLLYFGYTSCPDVCPTSLQVISMAMKKLGDKAKNIQPYFITVDPERDTVDVIKKYVSYFGPNLIGLTGSKAMIERVAQEYRVRYEKVVEEGMDPDMYVMDHTASVFFMAPDGRFITKFAYGISPDSMVKKINEYMQ